MWTIRSFNKDTKYCLQILFEKTSLCLGKDRKRYMSLFMHIAALSSAKNTFQTYKSENRFRTKNKVSRWIECFQTAYGLRRGRGGGIVTSYGVLGMTCHYRTNPVYERKSLVRLYSHLFQSPWKHILVFLDTNAWFF